MTTSTEPRSHPPGRFDEVISIIFGTTITVVAVIYIAVPFVPVLVAWEAVAVVYLLLVFTKFRNRRRSSRG